MTQSRKTYRGYLYIAAATFSWGVAASLGRAAFTGRLLPHGHSLQPIDPLILSQSRTTLSFLLFLPVLALARGWKRLRLPKGELLQAALLGILGVAASNYFYYVAIQKTNVATAIIVQYSAPIWVLLYTITRGLQKPSSRRVAAVLLAVCGIALVIGILGPSASLHLNVIGVVAALLAAIAFAFYNIAGHGLLSRHDHWTIVLYTTGSAALFWIVINPPWKVAAAHYSSSQWLFLVVFAIVSVLIPFTLYFAGLKYLEPTKAIVTSCLEPVFSILIAAVTLGELLRPLQTVGIVLVLVAIVVVQLPGRGEGPAMVVEPME